MRGKPLLIRRSSVRVTQVPPVKRKSESEAEANSPLALQAHAQGEQAAAQG